MKRIENMIKEFPVPVSDRIAMRYTEDDEKVFATETERYQKALTEWKKDPAVGPIPHKPIRKAKDYISPSDLITELNILGDAGWEIAGFYPSWNGISCVFKRELQ